MENNVGIGDLRAGERLRQTHLSTRSSCGSDDCHRRGRSEQPSPPACKSRAAKGARLLRALSMDLIVAGRAMVDAAMAEKETIDYGNSSASTRGAREIYACMDLNGAQVHTRRESRTHRSQRQRPCQDTREAAMAAAATASPRKKSALGRGQRSHARSAPRPGQLRCQRSSCGRPELVGRKEGCKLNEHSSIEAPSVHVSIYGVGCNYASDGWPGVVAANARFRRWLCIPLLV